MVMPKTAKDLAELREAVSKDGEKNNSDLLMLGTILISCTILIANKIDSLVCAIQQNIK